MVVRSIGPAGLEMAFAGTINSLWSFAELCSIFPETAEEVGMGWSLSLFAGHIKGGKVFNVEAAGGLESSFSLSYFDSASLQRKNTSDAEGVLTSAIASMMKGWCGGGGVI